MFSVAPTVRLRQLRTEFLRRLKVIQEHKSIEVWTKQLLFLSLPHCLQITPIKTLRRKAKEHCPLALSGSPSCLRFLTSVQAWEDVVFHDGRQSEAEVILLRRDRNDSLTRTGRR
ncbi:hypothetical protein CVT26_000508 [Gymnopilus dilepis]|uniref:Uncharacterized protein n=1 Tax=Gymnopilus dilepis TaxID=231916 RepID=A0A409VH33_9AGAR|nr:hypothetical protein CVT26_000508 [Gymnopilus dilepis]